MIPTCDMRQGDCLKLLREMPDESVQCCITSPPYWGLRDYGIDGQMGLEKTPEQFVVAMTEVFEEVRRVLKSDGTCWINIGDSYAGSWGSQGREHSTVSISQQRARQVAASAKKASGTGSVSHLTGIKPKDLVGIPWMLAFALRTAGWYLRQDIIWHKPNPMPESVTDRNTKSHEYIFLLTKSGRYYYDQEAIREPASESTHARLSQDVQAQIGGARANGGAKTNGNMKAVARKAAYGSIEECRSRQSDAMKSCPTKTRNGIRPATAYKAGPRVKDNESMNSALAIMPLDRNKRSVWTVPTYSFSEAHFATFPPDLIRPCVRAGSRLGDVVLDIFGGSGTTGLVALEEGRSAILLELNPAYIEIAKRRTNVTPGLPL